MMNVLKFSKLKSNIQSFRPNLTALAPFVVGYAAYRTLILLALNNDILNNGQWDQPHLYTVLFSCWSVCASIVLVVAIVVFPLRKFNHKRVARVILGFFVVSAVCFGLYIIEALKCTSFLFLILMLAVATVSATFIQFFVLYYLLSSSLISILVVVAVGRLIAYMLFYLSKHVDAFLQLSIILFSIVCLTGSAFYLCGKQKQSKINPLMSGFGDFFGCFSNSVILGVSASSLGVGILWGSSGAVNMYQLWVVGATVVCFVFLVILIVNHSKINSQLMIRNVFIILGLAMLLAVCLPYMNSFFMATVWMAYTIMDFCIYLLADKGKNKLIIITALAISTFLVACGLNIGSWLTALDNGIDTVTIVSVVLMLACVILFSQKDCNTFTDEVIQVAKASDEIACCIDLENALREKAKIFSIEYELTEAEIETLYYLVKGLTINRIATERFVSPNTIKTQIASIYQKCDVHSKQDLLEKFSLVDYELLISRKSGDD